MRFGWIAALAPAAQGVRWACGLLLLPAVWLAKGGAPDATTTVVSGHIDHPTAREIAVVCAPTARHGGPGSRVVARLDARGNFRAAVPRLAAPAGVTLAYGPDTAPLFLTPGDHLRLTLDPAHFAQSLRFAGPGSAANNFLAEDFLKFDENGFARGPQPKIETSGPAQFVAAVDDYHRQRLAFFAAYAATHPLSLPPAFRAFVRQRLAFERANYLLIYGHVQPFMHKDEPLPANYYDFLAAVRPAQDSALAMHNPRYTDFLSLYAATRLVEAAEAPSTGEALVAAARQQFGDGPGRDVVLAEALLNVLPSYSAADAAPLLANFRRTNRDSALAGPVRAAYRQLLALEPGQPGPAFAARDEAGRPVSLADFKGKVVYVDFWASWCRPCLDEIPAGAALRQQFAGQDVVFLNLSLDRDEAKWKAALAAHPDLAGSGSVQAWAKGGEDPAIVPYQALGIPRYCVIGRDGRIANSRAPRPSDAAPAAAALTQALAAR